MTGATWSDDDVISIYSRADAIDDGVLVDVTPLAREAGYRVPVAITAGLHAALSDIPAGSGEDYVGRLWDLLNVSVRMARRVPRSSDRIHYEMVLNRPGHPRGAYLAVWSLCGPGDAGEPVVTIMLADED